MKSENSKSSGQDRVNLSVANTRKIEIYLDQIKTVFSDSIRISKSDLVNLILSEFEPKLSKGFLRRTFFHLYDEVKFFTWAKPKILESRQKGQSVGITDLKDLMIKQLEGVEEGTTKKRHKPSPVRASGEIEPDPSALGT